MQFDSKSILNICCKYNSTLDFKIGTLYFSIQPLDNWIYETGSDTTTAEFMGYGPSNSITLYPNDIDVDTAIETGNALVANFKQDDSYNVKNAPSSHYVKYNTKNIAVSIISQENITIDEEPAVKVLANGKGDLADIKYLFIYTMQHC